MRLTLILLLLAGCSTTPQIDWPAGPVGPTPILLPISDLLTVPDNRLDARGAALAAQAASLRAQAAAIGG